VDAFPQLHWQTSELASYYHAADAVRRGRPLAERALTEALAGPLAELQAALREERIPEPAFWSHLLPLSATNISMQELAQRSLIKAAGPNQDGVRIIRVRELIYAIRNACATALPGMRDPATWRLEPLQQHWAQSGLGLLSRIVERTEPDILVEEATVVGLYPVQGGGGTAHVAYNLACIEAVTETRESSLPEVVRLAWQLSMLNLDLPRYSEKIRAGRLALVAGLAMLPAAVAAAADIRLIPTENLETAVHAWMPEAEVRLKTLTEWWDTYQRLRPSWRNSLKALDLLLVDRDSNPAWPVSES
jgi:hypothetical protein